MCDIVTHNWGVDFNIISPMENLPRILNIHESTINDSRYQWSSEEHGQYKSEETSIFQFTLSGCGAFDDGDNVHRLPSGTAFLTNTMDKHYRYYYPESLTERQVVLWCNFQSSYSMKMVEEINSRFGYIFHLPETTGIIKKLLDLKSLQESYSTMLASENAKLASELLYELIWSKEKENTGNIETVLIEKALQIINTNSNRLYNAGELADKLSISREHLSRVFKRQLGISPYRYIISSKIEMAKMKLRNTSIPAKSISHELGFTSPVQFTNMFKKDSGITPGNYRKIYRGK
ncbi:MULTISPECIES: AraC family transcriptional regulator [unclassified Oceanispirochaeta]|uniref:helix-turn-helix domain-containing protein n=1 Tax=unclassified Oceanispirochaeta TaxID=2635722 RepID=UPI000E099E94|nr:MULTISPECIES: AraC family transcriptional regulator [unclassified Oceanispirochaeta]MBF9015198.1 helix-turn-helix transcriptional regulator [Oceanispirochaeta sp. M2]NPD71656.1 helix-turn-helix transcriptional regulator [Oceanispirochaeta sp. M1]RDG32853.1 AraC family transcriptional regulator [Oceanispirochaeta sp. M1]